MTDKKILIIKKPGKQYTKNFPFLDTSSLFTISLIFPEDMVIKEGEGKVIELSREDLINSWTEIDEEVDLNHFLVKERYKVYQLRGNFNIFFGTQSKDEKYIKDYVKRLEDMKNEKEKEEHND